MSEGGLNAEDRRRVQAQRDRLNRLEEALAVRADDLPDAEYMAALEEAVIALTDRVDQLEDALAEYLGVIANVPFRVPGNLQAPYLEAEKRVRLLLPPGKRPPTPPGEKVREPESGTPP